MKTLTLTFPDEAARAHFLTRIQELNLSFQKLSDQRESKNALGFVRKWRGALNEDLLRSTSDEKLQRILSKHS